jgi:uroporphyrinogen decarboxylase
VSGGNIDWDNLKNLLMEKIKINSRERVFTALNLKESDRVPVFEWEIDPKVINEICRGCSLADFVEKFDLDGVYIDLDYHNKKLNEDTIIDEWGVTRKGLDEMNTYPVEHPIKSEKDFDNFTPPDPFADYRFNTLIKIVKRFKSEKAIIVHLNDVFSIPRDLRGMANFLMDYYLNPNLAKRLIDFSLDYNIKAAEVAINLGADIIMLGDDYASNTGLLMSPAHFKEFILPGLTKIVKKIKDKGSYVIKHTDGDITSIISIIIDTGIDGIDPIDPQAGMDIEEVKKRYGHKVCIKGNVNCGYTLSNGSDEEVVREVKKCISKAARGGGYILSSSNSIHSKVNPRNFLTMIRTIKKFGKYPITI